MQIHGHHVDKIKGRFSGTIDEVDEDEFKFDRMVVCLVVGRTSVGSIDTKDDGEVHAVMKIKVTDMSALEGPLRDQAIAYLAHGSEQGILDFGNYRHKGDEPKPPKIEGQEALPVADYAQPPEAPPGVDANGEVIHTPLSRARVVQDPDEEFDVPPAEDPVRPRVTDVTPPQAPVEAPRTARDPAPAPSGTVVGQVRKGERKDSALADFLNE